MSAIPPELADADEKAVLASLSRMLADKRLNPCQARGLYVAWRVAQDSQYYARFEMTTKWRRET
jgi:hypothetical protein